MSNTLLPCPFCGGEAFVATVEHLPENRPNGYRFHGQIMCRNCQASEGTMGFDLTHEEATRKAIAAWNRRAQPENEPHTNDALTRDDLYYLDGEPLYVMDGEGHECYCVVNTKNEDCIDNEAGAWCFEFYDMTGDGKHGLHKMGWRAYRMKPERSEG